MALYQLINFQIPVLNNTIFEINCASVHVTHLQCIYLTQKLTDYFVLSFCTLIFISYFKIY